MAGVGYTAPMRFMGLVIAAALAAGCGGGSGDGGDGGTPAVDAAAQGSSEYLFDDTVLRTYELVVAPADWAELNANIRAEQYVPATVRFEGTDYAGAGVRYKGAVGSLQNQGPIDELAPCFDGAGNHLVANCPKLSLKVSFNEYDPEGRFFGVKKLQFHSMHADPSKLREALAYSLFRDSDVHAPRTAFARLVVNGELLGLYVLVEQIDGRFTRERFPDGGEGNLYKEVWPVAQTAQPYLDALKTNEDENPSVDKMVRFATALANATDETFEATLEEWTDVDMLVRKMAVDRAIDHWDGIVAWYCPGPVCFNHNYYWYESTTEDRVWLIPWDVDRSLDAPPPIRTIYGMPDWDETTACDPITIFFGIGGRPPHCDPFIGRMADQLWDRYAAASRVLLDGPYSTTAVNPKLDRWGALIADAVEEDPHLDTSTWQAAIVELRANIAELRSLIEAKLAP